MLVIYWRELELKARKKIINRRKVYFYNSKHHKRGPAYTLLIILPQKSVRIFVNETGN